jgi:hypothetical protein
LRGRNAEPAGCKGMLCPQGTIIGDEGDDPDPDPDFDPDFDPNLDEACSGFAH